MTISIRIVFPLVEPLHVEDPDLAEIIERGSAVLACPGLDAVWEQVLSSPELLQFERDIEALSRSLDRAAERGSTDAATRDGES